MMAELPNRPAVFGVDTALGASAVSGPNCFVICQLTLVREFRRIGPADA